MFIWYIFGDRSLYIQHSAAYSCGPLQLMLFFYLSILGAQFHIIRYTVYFALFCLCFLKDGVANL